MTEKRNVSGAVLRLWKAVPREVRLSFERHPVDDVRTLEAERDRLRKKLYGYEAAGTYLSMMAERDQLREALETIRDRRTDKGVPFYHDAERSIAAAALDPTPDDYCSPGIGKPRHCGDPTCYKRHGNPTEAPEEENA